MLYCITLCDALEVHKALAEAIIFHGRKVLLFSNIDYREIEIRESQCDIRKQVCDKTS